MLAGRRDLTLAARDGGTSHGIPVAVMPITGIADPGMATRFLVTPISHAVTFPANTVANSTAVNGQAIIGPRHQHRGDLTAEVLLTAGDLQGATSSDVFFDRDENPVSGRIPRRVTCVGAVDVRELFSEGVLLSVGEFGGWSSIAVRSPGPLAELGGDPNRPTAARTAFTNQAAIIKLEFNAEGRFAGAALSGAFNNAFWLRSGIRESVPPTLAPACGARPCTPIRSVPDERGQAVQVGEDFVGDRLELAR